jgi:hypothetical protein
LHDGCLVRANVHHPVALHTKLIHGSYHSSSSHRFITRGLFGRGGQCILDVRQERTFGAIMKGENTTFGISFFARNFGIGFIIIVVIVIAKACKGIAVVVTWTWHDV